MKEENKPKIKVTMTLEKRRVGESEPYEVIQHEDELDPETLFTTRVTDDGND